jgi:hypothetical protein
MGNLVIIYEANGAERARQLRSAQKVATISSDNVLQLAIQWQASMNRIEWAK